jgi:hypothetical protein
MSAREQPTLKLCTSSCILKVLLCEHTVPYCAKKLLMSSSDSSGTNPPTNILPCRAFAFFGSTFLLFIMWSPADKTYNIHTHKISFRQKTFLNDNLIDTNFLMFKNTIYKLDFKISTTPQKPISSKGKNSTLPLIQGHRKMPYEWSNDNDRT